MLDPTENTYFLPVTAIIGPWISTREKFSSHGKQCSRD